MDSSQEKISMKAMFLRAVYKQYWDEDWKSAVVRFHEDFPVVRKRERITDAEYNYIFRPITQGE